MTVRILQGDCRDVLKMLPDESVHCVVTSPPYWGLRDYGVPGQIGMEATPYEFVDTLTAVFEDVRRVLRSDGTLWLNLGDSYAGSWGAQSRPDGNDAKSTLQGGSMLSARQIQAHPKGTHTGSLKNTPGLKPKDLCGVPWRTALALQAAGWWLRQDIIWRKPNPMPESVTDRCTKSHEYIFLLAKGEMYYYDAASIQEESVGTWNSKEGFGGSTKKSAGDPKLRYQGHGTFHADEEKNGRNKRSVWSVPTKAYSDAHFATFPTELIEPCILAGCPEGGTVLDPFGGAGTTALVADRHKRNAILIELNPEYAAMAERRIYNDAPLFADVANG